MTQRERKAPVLITVLMTLVAGVMGLVVCGGIGAAIAIPAFIGYTRRAKAAEATFNVEALRRGVTTYAVGEAADPATGALRARGLPPSLPLTPPTQGAQARLWPASADPLWADLGLVSADPLYYSYEVVSSPAAGTVRVRAVGDLDGDGVTSEFAREGRLDASGDIAWGPMTVTNELE